MADHFGDQITKQILGKTTKSRLAGMSDVHIDSLKQIGTAKETKMSCPTCDHTMQYLRTNLFWCPRCGTVRSDGANIHSPTLVGRVAEHLEELDSSSGRLWDASVATLMESVTHDD